MNIKFYISLVVVCFIVYGKAHARLLHFGQITTKDGLAEDIVNQVFEDSNGFLWVGTKSGLSFYDGNQCITFDDPMISSANIYSIGQDSNGDLYFGTYYSGIIKYVKDSAQFRPFYAFENNSAVSAISIHNDRLYVGSLGGGVVLLDIEGNELHELNSGASVPQLYSEVITDVVIKNGSIVIAYNGEVIDFIDLKTNNLVRKRFSDRKAEQFNGFGTKILFKNDNEYFVAAEDFGLFWVQSDSIIANYTITNSDLSSNFITDLAFADDSTLLIGTDGKGLDIFSLSDKAFSNYQTKYIPQGAISSNAIYDIIVDKNKIIWLATFNGGLNYAITNSNKLISNSNLNELNARFTNNSVLSICETDNQKFFIGTDGAGLKLVSKDCIVEREYYEGKKDSSINSNIIKSLLLDSKGNLWMGSYAKGVSILGGKNTAFQPIVDKLNKSSVWSITEDKSGIYWFGTLYEGVFTFNPATGQVQNFRHNVNSTDSLPSISVLKVFVDRANTVWLGTDGGGVCVFNRESNSFIRLREKFKKQSVINDIFQDRNGIVWVADDKNGIFIVDSLLNCREKRFITSKLPSKQISAIKQDGNGAIWFTCENHVCRVKGDSLLVFGNSYGIDVGKMNIASLAIFDNLIFSGGTKGIACLPNNIAISSPPVPKGAFTQLNILGAPVEPNSYFEDDVILTKPIYELDTLILPVDVRSFDLKYSCINSLLLSGYKFRYKLDGLDETYKYFSAPSIDINYSSLKAGNYNLIIEYYKGNNFWEETSRLTVVATPRFWEIKQVKFMLIVLFISLISCGYFIIFRIKERQRVKLEKRVEERTNEVLSQQKILLEKQSVLESINAKVIDQKKNLEAQQNDLIASHNQIERQNKELHEQSAYLQDVNEEMHAQNDRIFEQTQILQMKNELLTKSLNYARRIQNTLFPTEKQLLDTISNSFVYFSPKEIVSGDFYWLRKIDDVIVLAVVDCTGHGVPGAFMSMIGNALLNEIVVNRKIIKPDEILYNLNTEMIRIFNIGDFDAEAQDDGMDLTVCVIDDKTVEVSSAMQNFYIYNDDKIEVYNGDIFSIGGLMAKFKKPVYTSHVFEKKEGLSIFMCSDGIVDQFGGVEREKFGVERFVNLLHKTVLHKSDDRKSVVDLEFNSWIGENEQLDDAIIVGIQF